ncbi:MAG: hypothetical protein ACJAQ0_001291 [Dasania sp.]
MLNKKQNTVNTKPASKKIDKELLKEYIDKLNKISDNMPSTESEPLIESPPEIKAEPEPLIESPPEMKAEIKAKPEPNFVPIQENNNNNNITKKITSIKKSVKNHNPTTLQIVRHYLKLFMRTHAKILAVSGLALSGIYLMSNLIQFFITPSLKTQFIFKAIIMTSALLIGMYILRQSVLKKKERPITPFFKGFSQLLGLYFITGLIIIATIFVASNMITLINQSFIPQTIALIVGVAISSVTTGIILTRFSFLVPLTMIEDEEGIENALNRVSPYATILFTTISAAKIICLGGIIILNLKLAATIAIPLGALLFAFYHILIFSLIGVCFKVSQKQAH